MRAQFDFGAILKRHGQSVTLATGATSLACRAIVGTARRELDSRQGGYGNQSAITLTALAADLANMPITPHTTTCTVNNTLWRVTNYADSQANSGIKTITLGPINP